MSTTEVHPQISTPAELLALAAHHGLHLTSDAAEFDATGLDFLVVHATDGEGAPWIVRTPRRRAVAEASAVEARVLRRVAPHLPVAVPDWRLHSEHVIAYPRLPGTPAVSILPAGPRWNIDPADPPASFLDSFAAVVAALQRVPGDDLRHRTIAAEREQLARTMHAARDALAPSPATWTRWQRWLADDDLWPPYIALVHGDLHPGHLLLADDGRITGVLDWTEARVSDPSIDLAMFLGCFGRPALEQLMPRLERHGFVPWPRLVDHAAERWAAGSALAAEWALATANAAVLEHARALLAAVEA
jgi:aminoglycoside phosphotransferase (APT) family kinase protein